jgi:hypothetical protein
LVQVETTETRRPVLASVNDEVETIFESLTLVVVRFVWLEMSGEGAKETSCQTIWFPVHPFAKESP